MEEEESWVNLQLEIGKEKDNFYKTNTNKENEVNCFPFHLLMTLGMV